MILPDDDEEPGANVAVLPDTPAAEAGLPAACRLTKWNDEELESSDDLRAQLSVAAVEEPIEVTFVEAEKTESVTISATKRPETSPPVEAEFRRRILKFGTAIGWNRQELKKEGRKQQTWYFAPVPDESIAMGTVVLLSESSNSPAGVLKRWSKVCEQNNLVLVVPSNNEGTPLGREDLQSVMADVSEIAKAFDPDKERTTLVADTAQASLATAMLLNPRLPQFQSAVFNKTWPQIAGLADSALKRKPSAVLLLSDGKDNRTQQALRQVTSKRLKSSQAHVTEDSAKNAATKIADWLVGLKVR